MDCFINFDNRFLFRDLIKSTDHSIDTTQKMVHLLHHFMQESRNNLDALQAKDKALDKAFKREFSETSAVVQENALKLYK